MLTYLIILIILLYSLGSSVPLLAGNVLADRLRQQFGPFSHLDVQVVTSPPIWSLSGQVDSLRIHAASFSVDGVPISTASLETAPFHVPVFSLLGHPQWPSSVAGTASATLSEADLNKLLHSKQVLAKLKNIPLQFSLFPGVSTTRMVTIHPGQLYVVANQLLVDGMADMGGGAIFPFSLQSSPHLAAPDRLDFDDIQANFAGAMIPPSYLGSATPSLDFSKYQRPGKNFQITSFVLTPGLIQVVASFSITDFH